MIDEIEYTFPFDTCEIPNEKGIAQPYSMIITFTSCIIILYYLLKTKKFYNFFLIFMILSFQLVHSFSHYVHIKGTIQLKIIHTIVYFIELAVFLVFYSYTKKFPSSLFTIYLIILIGFDIYAFMNLSVFYYIFTQTVIFLSLFFYYYKLFPKNFQKSANIILFVTIFILGLILNEKINCKKMLDFYPFPYHIFIEIIGAFLFYIICSNFYKL
jgi:hypothetical protein